MTQVRRRPTALGLLRAVAVVLAACAGSATAYAAEPAAGGLRGTVRDRDFEAPLGGARISIVEAHLGTVSGEAGNYLFESVAPGSYTVLVSKDGYERRLLHDVVVAPGRLTDLDVSLVSEVVDMEELVVTGVDLLADSELGVLEIRAEALSVQDALSAEAIGKAGASDVAAALKLVVGASVVEGKYATVRGLSDRYTGTTLNGVRVPSADPRRRAVQVDLFPTATIEGITVSKTFTPDLFGDFTGGGLDIRTRSTPEDPILAFSASVGHDSLATGESAFLTYAGGGVERLGFHGAGRDYPRVAWSPLPLSLNAIKPTFKQPAAEQARAVAAYDAYTRGFAPVMGTTRERPGRNSSYSIAAGDRFSLGSMPLGVMAAVTFDHRYEFYEGGTSNRVGVSVAGSEPTVVERDDTRGLDETLLGAVASFELQPAGRHAISLDLIYNQAAQDEARLLVTDNGSTPELLSVGQNQVLHYSERRVGSAQLHGRHGLGDLWNPGEPGADDLRLDWMVSHNFTGQDEPDVRFFRNNLEFDHAAGTGSIGFPGGGVPDAGKTRRIFREIEEQNGQAALNLVLPLTPWGGAAGEVKAGLYADRTGRDSFQRSASYSFALQVGSIFNPAYQQNLSRATLAVDHPDVLWTDTFLSAENLGLAGNRCDTPPPNPGFAQCAALNQLLWVLNPLGEDVDYSGEQRLDAVYAMAELPLAARLKLVGGARRESTKMEVVPTNATFGLIETIEVQPTGDRAIVQVDQALLASDIDETALLPAFGLVWAVIPQMNLRASWSRTIARPNFRELAPVATEEFLAGDAYLGNPALELSDITNHDLRWEWFRRPGQLFAASAFRKAISDPIELISFSVASSSFVQPVNYERGRVRGFELEARSGFGEIADWLDDLALGVNAAWIDSEVDVPLAERASLAPFGLDEPTRRLQGQPEFLFNAHLTYDNPRSGTSLGVFYSVVGETLLAGAARGEDGTPNLFERPDATLDVKLAQKIGPHVSLALGGKNLLHQDRETVHRTPGGLEALKSRHETAYRSSLAVKVEW